MNTSETMQSRLQFVGCDEDMCAALRELKPIVAEALPGILDGFYEHMAGFDDAAKMFDNPEDMVHVRDMQVKHWERITQGTFDEDYLSSVNRIGEVHYKLGLTPRWYIGGYALLIAGLIKAADASVPTSRFGGDKGHDQRTRLARAITTAALLDMDLAITIYLEQGEKSKAETLDWLSKSFGDIIGMITKSSGDIEVTAINLTQAADNTQRLSTEVSTASGDASASVQSVASATEQLGASVNEIRRQVSDSSRIATQAVGQVEQTDVCISQLIEAAGRIGDVVKLITAISDQTKLLALNATIEAERAGESGQGFAVVAQEVKALAAQTASATSEIGAQISAIQGATDDSVSAIKEISRIINEIAGISTSIASAVEEQGAATSEIANSAQQAAKGTSTVAANITDVNKGAVDTGVASSQVLAAAQHLAGESGRMKTEVQSFIDKLRAA